MLFAGHTFSVPTLRGSRRPSHKTQYKSETVTLSLSEQVHTFVMFPPRDRDNDNHGDNCAVWFTGGWWYNQCTRAHLTGMHTSFRTTIDTFKQIRWHDGGDRGDSHDSWKEATIMLVPKGEFFF